MLVVGVSGACRCDELVNMKIQDIEDMKTLLHIKIPYSKTYKSRSFTIVNEKFLQIYRKYASLRPKEMKDSRFFVKYGNGKCQKAVMGIHKIGSVPKEVAKFLKLPNPNLYTGHCLRRTSATLLVDGGADLTCLKRHGGWKSGTVAEGYIEESMANKNHTARKIFSSCTSIATASDDVKNVSPSPSIEITTTNQNETYTIEASAGDITNMPGTSSGFNFQNASINNCTFNLTFNNVNKTS